MLVPIHRQRKGASQAGPIQGKCAERQFRDWQFLEVIVEESLNALIGWAKMIGQQSFLLAIRLNESGKKFVILRAACGGYRLMPKQRQLCVNVRDRMSAGIKVGELC